MKVKLVDDLSILELINLITVGLSSYNVKQQVPSDIGVDQKYLPCENILTQSHVNNLVQWTKEIKMMLNGQKTKLMIINFTNNYQFSTRIHLEREDLNRPGMDQFSGDLYCLIYLISDDEPVGAQDTKKYVLPCHPVT